VSTKRLRRDDWLTLALAQLAALGPDALKIDAICSAAGVTKGSFYHHFGDHGRFVEAVADQWIETQTRALIRGKDPRTLSQDELDTFVEATLSLDIALEIRIRELGRRVPAVGAKIHETDQVRLEFTAAVYAERLGMAADLARDMAMLDYGAFLGVMLLDPDMPTARRRSLAGLFDRLVQAYMVTTSRPAS